MTIPFLVFMVIGPPTTSALSWLKVRKKPAIKGLRTVTLTSDHVAATGKAYDVSLAWKDVYRVTHSLGQTLVWIGPHGAVLVPDSAFPDKAAAMAFHAEALRLFAAGKAAAAKSTLDG